MTKRLTRPHKKIGRPSTFKPEYTEIAYDLSLLGFSDQRIAKNLRVSLNALAQWKRDFPVFGEAFANGRERADGKVARSLFERATGYSHPDIHISAAKDGSVIITPIIKRYPPDTSAANFFLANRQRELWRRDPVAGDVNINFSLEQLVLDSIKLREAERAKIIEHQPLAKTTTSVEREIEDGGNAGVSNRGR
jgi:hypothetical protein